MIDAIVDLMMPAVNHGQVSEVCAIETLVSILSHVLSVLHDLYFGLGSGLSFKQVFHDLSRFLLLPIYPHEGILELKLGLREE